MNVLDNSVMIKGSNSGITVFLDSEMAFEDLLKSVSEYALRIIIRTY